MVMDADKEFVLETVAEVARLPSNSLCAPRSFRVDLAASGTAIEGLARLLLVQAESAKGQEPGSKSQIADVMALLCKKACASKDYTLTFVGELARAMDGLANERNVNAFVAFWKTAAAAVRDHVDKHQEVDQKAKGSGVEHDISGVREVLAFPLKHLRSETGRQLWKQWVDLLSQGSVSRSFPNGALLRQRERH